MSAPIVIFDIDGTLANAEHRVHHVTKTPKDWPAFFKDMDKDEPIEGMVAMVDICHAAGTWIMLLTGREETHREVTEEWLQTHGIPYDVLIMRRKGDRRGDDIIKVEALAKHLSQEDRDDIVTIFEDRKRVVVALREAGYHVSQVAEGDF